jgi:hypothetical protein
MIRHGSRPMQKASKSPGLDGFVSGEKEKTTGQYTPVAVFIERSNQDSGICTDTPGCTACAFAVTTSFIELCIFTSFIVFSYCKIIARPGINVNRFFLYYYVYLIRTGEATG